MPSSVDLSEAMGTLLSNLPDKIFSVLFSLLASFLFNYLNPFRLLR